MLSEKLLPSQTESDRLATLRSYRVLDTPPEPVFDDLVQLAARACQAPIALISLIDERRQWFKAEVGLGVRETPLDRSICLTAMLLPGLTIVPDLTEDPRFARNPLVTGEPHLRFYAGAVLETPDGVPLGALCVLDCVPRDLTEEQASTLTVLARQVMSQLELRRAIAERNGRLETSQQIEQRQTLLVGELHHRVKNNLATVQSIAAQTLRGTEQLPEARRSFQDRILALAAAHDSLTREQWEGAGPAEIAHGVLDPLAGADGRILIAGPKLVLPPRAALGLSMAFHELGTNALKYGALTQPDGRVEIRWTREADELVLIWSERGGPPVTPPDRQGFGSRLLTRGLAAELRGSVNLSYSPAGLECQIHARLDASPERWTETYRALA